MTLACCAKFCPWTSRQPYNLQPSAQDVRRPPESPSVITPVLFTSKVALSRVRVTIGKNSNIDTSRIGLAPDRTGNLPNVHSSAQTKAHWIGGDIDAPCTTNFQVWSQMGGLGA